MPLALGTFGLGLTEYVMMGILPDVAKSMNCSIPMAGHFISLYALGVVFGSILLVIVARTRPLKQILVALAVIFTVANLLGIAFGTFLSHNFSWRITFLIVGLFGFLILTSILKMVPYLKPFVPLSLRLFEA